MGDEDHVKTREHGPQVFARVLGACPLLDFGGNAILRREFSVLVLLPLRLGLAHGRRRRLCLCAQVARR